MRRITPDQRNKEITREEFSRQVVSLSNSPAFRDERVLDRIAAAVAATGSHRVLDLACGPGLVSRRLARDARFVVGVDLTPAMLERASEQSGARAAFVLAAAERLPLASGSCERAVTRLALHHLPDPGPALREMARVVAPGGRVVVADIASSENARDASLHNELERLRDPSHVRMLPPGELLERIGEAARNAKLDIIINVENLRQATPGAIQALLDGEALNSVTPYAKVRYRNFKAAFEEDLGGCSLAGLEMLKEDWQDA